MLIKMRNGNVALEEVAASEKSQGGIYIPTTVPNRGKLRFGKVVEIGPGELIQGQFVAMDLEKGQEVLFDFTRSEAIEFEGKKLIICNMIDVIATVSAKHLSLVPSPEPANEIA